MSVDIGGSLLDVICFHGLCILLNFFFFFLQNAGAVIGKGGKNIKALRTDVSVNQHTLICFYSFHNLQTRLIIGTL